MSEKIEDTEKGKAQSGAGSVQRSTQGRKAELRQKIVSIRQGHGTGGYCDSEALKLEEQKLHNIITGEIEEEEKKQQPDHQAIRLARRELAGFAYKPRLVVAQDQTI